MTTSIALNLLDCPNTDRFIVKLTEGMWLMGGDGNPPRTLVMNDATPYTYEQAERALMKARMLPYRDDYPDAQILRRINAN